MMGLIVADTIRYLRYYLLLTVIRLSMFLNLVQTKLEKVQL